jgi:hypothetical protein
MTLKWWSHGKGKVRKRETTTLKSQYLSYMLRLWQESSSGSPVWRASLESPLTGERTGFAGLVSLILFLEEKTGGNLTHTPGREDCT